VEAGYIACCFAPPSVSEVVLTGLSSGVKYRFRITAISSIGHATSRPSVWVKTPESLASAVKMNELKALGQSSVRLRWPRSSLNGFYAYLFAIESRKMKTRRRATTL
jgi:hypothetical protein